MVNSLRAVFVYTFGFFLIRSIGGFLFYWGDDDGVDAQNGMRDINSLGGVKSLDFASFTACTVLFCFYLINVEVDVRDKIM